MRPIKNLPLLVFDFSADGNRAQRLCLTDPLRIIVAASLSEVRPALRAVEQAAKEGMYAAGYVRYEAAPAFDPAMVVREASRMPLLWFAIFQEPTAAMLECYEAEGALRICGDAFSVSGWHPSVRRTSYCKNIASIREAIAHGHTYPGQLHDAVAG